MFNIILQQWFSINPSFQLLESKDEDEDTFSTKLDLDLMRKGLELSHQLSRLKPHIKVQGKHGLNMMHLIKKYNEKCARM